MSRLFGTDGVRGVANADLTPELAFRLGEAAGHFLGDRGRGRIVVGKDTRRSGDMLEAALIAGICSGGAQALAAGIVPTPAVALLTRQLGADGGVVVSASHNPAEYNGIKLFSREGFKLPDEVEDEIAAFVEADRSWARPVGADLGTCERVEDAAERYIDHAVGSVRADLSGLRVAVDCGHGAAARTTVPALMRLGAEVTALNCDWNGMDINERSGSTDLSAVTDLVATSQGQSQIRLSPPVFQALDALRDFLFAEVYLRTAANDEHERAVRLLRELFAHFLAHPDELPPEYHRAPGDLPTRVADFVAGMTDRYAVRTYEQLFLPQGWLL